MASIELNRYIAQQIQQGIKQEELIRTLLANHWPLSDIEEALRETTPAPKDQFNPRVKKISIIVLAILAGVLILVLGFYIGRKRSKETSIQPFETQDILSAAPIPFDNKAIFTLHLSYNLRGSIERFKENGTDGASLKLKGLPEFRNIKDLKVFHTKGSGVSGPGSLADLKPGLLITVAASYNLKEPAWIVNGIYIPEESIP